MPRLRSGFSLVELLVVIAILGVLLSLAGLGVRGLLDRGRLNEGLALVDLRINEARLGAKRTDQTVVLDVYADRLEVDGQRSMLPSGVAASISGAPLSIIFEPPFGTYGGSGQSFSLASGDASANIAIVGTLARTVVTR